MLGSLRIGIVGGSIAGMTTAVLLRRQSHQVTVFERSAGVLEERGAGIGLPKPFVKILRDRDLVDADTRGLNASTRVWCVAEGNRDLGRVLGVQPMHIDLHHWGLLYRQVCRRVDEMDIEIRRGCEVNNVVDDESGCTVHLVDCAIEEFDVVVGADGYRSRMRSVLFPHARLQYAGYPVWRGILPESYLADSSPVEDLFQSVGTPGGHAPFYFVPGRNGECDPGQRRLNWTWYDTGAPADILGARTGGVGAAPEVSGIGAGRMPPAMREYLHRIAREQLPPWFRDVVLVTPNPYIQPVYDLEVEHYTRGAVCLVGDAGSLARPHTAFGTAKAIQDALSLAEALDRARTISEALMAYDSVRSVAGSDFVRMGRIFGSEQVVDIPSWADLTERQFNDWLERGSSRLHYAFK